MSSNRGFFLRLSVCVEDSPFITVLYSHVKLLTPAMLGICIDPICSAVECEFKLQQKDENRKNYLRELDELEEVSYTTFAPDFHLEEVLCNAVILLWRGVVKIPCVFRCWNCL